MTDFKRKGTRCRAKRMIRGHTATIAPFSEGTIAYEIESLERRLIFVEWDAEASSYVFADEIEILNGNDNNNDADIENGCEQPA